MPGGRLRIDFGDDVLKMHDFQLRAYFRFGEDADESTETLPE
jgi:hypothetical protein